MGFLRGNVESTNNKKLQLSFKWMLKLMYGRVPAGGSGLQEKDLVKTA
jgi:hypothetical protein